MHARKSLKFILVFDPDTYYIVTFKVKEVGEAIREHATLATNHSEAFSGGSICWPTVCRLAGAGSYKHSCVAAFQRFWVNSCRIQNIVTLPLAKRLQIHTTNIIWAWYKLLKVGSIKQDVVPITTKRTNKQCVNKLRNINFATFTKIHQCLRSSNIQKWVTAYLRYMLTRSWISIALSITDLHLQWLQMPLLTAFSLVDPFSQPA